MHKRFIFPNIQKFYYYVISYILVCFLIFYIYKNIPSYENRLRLTLLSQSIDGVDASSDRLIEKIVNGDPDFLKKNISYESLRKRNEKYLKEFRNRNISSIYLIFTTDNGRSFILIDSNNRESASEILVFILEDIDKNSLRKAKRSREKQVYIQNDIDTLGFTFLKPIVIDGKAEAFLVIDYTQKTYNSLVSLLNISSKIIMTFLILIVILLSILIFLFIRNAYKKNRLYINPETGTLYRNYLSDNYEKINFTNYYIALADIDLFKRINDIYGHKVGDKVLNSIMKRIAELLSRDDIFIQYGGEEFLFLIYKKRVSIIEFKIKMDEIRVLVENLNIRVKGETLKLTISIGGFIQTNLATSLQDAIQKADSALYKSKHSGRNRVTYFDISKKKVLYREKLKDLIENDNLICFYQPIKDLKNLSTHHYEALFRLKDGGTIIYPNEIFPELENSYFYSRISMKIIEYNVKMLHMDIDFKISINLTSDDLVNESIVNLLIKNRDVADRMLIEILETKNIDYIKLEESIQKLKPYGYKICIDDYGSGYSNLSHLLNLSIDYLKIDGSIIKNIYNDRKSHALMLALSIFCKQNSIALIAEFVENEEILGTLKKFRIEYGQGYYFDKPKPYNELKK